MTITDHDLDPAELADLIEWTLTMTSKVRAIIQDRIDNHAHELSLTDLAYTVNVLVDVHDKLSRLQADLDSQEH